ncbi:MAG: peptide deformylase [Candidatus Dasytiphilus stammeri]
MSPLRLLIYPDQRLRTIARPVIKINQDILRIAENMLTLMYTENGIGLAATQVNIHQQIIVIDISEKKDKPLVLINPVLLETEGEISIEEGCLSIPEQKAFIPRAKKVTISTLTITGNPCVIKANNLLAICIQHEMDHLLGKIFIDYLTPIKQKKIFNKLKKMTLLCTNQD